SGSSDSENPFADSAPAKAESDNPFAQPAEPASGGLPFEEPAKPAKAKAAPAPKKADKPAQKAKAPKASAPAKKTAASPLSGIAESPASPTTRRVYKQGPDYGRWAILLVLAAAAGGGGYYAWQHTDLFVTRSAGPAAAATFNNPA